MLNRLSDCRFNLFISLAGIGKREVTEKLVVKSKLISSSFVLVMTLFIASLTAPVSAVAADNDVFEDLNDTRATQRSVLPDNGVNNLTSQQPRVSRRQASNLASGRYEGRVLSIRLDNNNWRVRMDREGTVFNVFVNASSGDVSASSD